MTEPPAVLIGTLGEDVLFNWQTGGEIFAPPRLPYPKVWVSGPYPPKVNKLKLIFDH